MLPAHPDSPIALSLISVDDKVVRLSAHTVAPGAVCPECRRPSSQIHDTYVRRPMDLPWRGYTVRLSLRVRRFRCPNRACARQTFAETAGEDLPKHARRTTGAAAALLDLARANGGEGGARLASRLGLPTSPDTLLRLLRRERTAAVPTPRVLGVDDFAPRRRQRYATVLVVRFVAPKGASAPGWDTGRFILLQGGETLDNSPVDVRRDSGPLT